MPVRHPDWEISVQEVKALLDAKHPMLLLDVRGLEEHRICKIDGAQLVPLNELHIRAADIREAAAGRPVIAHCHHGGRSLSAASLLREAGIPGVKSMAGGIDEWSCVIDSTVPRY